MAEGRFRRDLYYRLSVFPIAIPPLRERKEDVPLIVWAFIERRQGTLGRRIEQIPRQVMDALLAYDWPGNVRELENVLERAMILSPGRALRLDDPLRAPGGVWGSATAEPGPGSPAAFVAASDRSFDGVAREHVRAVLERCAWRINGPGGAAEVLAVHPNTLRSRMKRLGLVRPQARSIASLAALRRLRAGGIEIRNPSRIEAEGRLVVVRECDTQGHGSRVASTSPARSRPASSDANKASPMADLGCIGLGPRPSDATTDGDGHDPP